MTASPTVLPPDALDTGRLDGASKLRIFSVLAVIVLYTEITPLQYTMVAAALQKMSSTFPKVGANLSWSIIIVGLVGAAASPLLGKLSDVWGKKLIFLVCGVFFLVGALIDAMTHDWVVFLIGRGLQSTAVACGFISLSLIRDLLPRKYVSLGIGITATGLGFSAVVAPILGGYLVDRYDWHAMFWFLAIFTIVMTPIVMVVVPESKLRIRERFDPFGALLLSAGVALTLIYLDKGQDWGWGRPTTLAWLIGGLVLLVSFFVVENRVSNPIMDMKLLRNPRLSLVLAMAFFGTFLVSTQPYALAYMTQTPSAGQLKELVARGVVAQAHQMAGVTLPLSAIHVNLDPGYTYGSSFSLMQYGTHIALGYGIVAMIFGPVAGIVARRYSPRLAAIIALTIMVALGAVFALVSYSWVTFAVVGAIFAIGFGMFFASSPILVVEAVPAQQQGISVGMAGVTTGMGSAVALAVMTALLNNSPVKAHISVMGHSLTQTVPQIFADHGYIQAFWVGTGVAVIGLLIAIFMRHGRQPATGGTNQHEWASPHASAPADAATEPNPETETAIEPDTSAAPATGPSVS